MGGAGFGAAMGTTGAAAATRGVTGGEATGGEGAGGGGAMATCATGA